MPEPSHAESARTLVVNHLQGVMGTLDRRSGAPYNSVAEYVPLDNGDALVFTSNLADHTRNFQEDTRVSLLVAEGLGDSEALAEERVTLVGEIDPVDDDQVDKMRTRYLEGHPHAETYIDFEDFAFYRVVPEKLRYIGGFGKMSWVDTEDYREAAIDPIWPAADGIIRHMNQDHPDALVDMAIGLADFAWAEEAEMTSIDRFGFEMTVDGHVNGDSRHETTRIDFDQPLDEPAKARNVLTALTEQGRENAGGA